MMLKGMSLLFDDLLLSGVTSQLGLNMLPRLVFLSVLLQILTESFLWQLTISAFLYRVASMKILYALGNRKNVICEMIINLWDSYP